MCVLFFTSVSISEHSAYEDLKMFLSLASILSFLTVFIPVAHSGKILVFPHDGSHWVNMRVLVEELHLQGHNVTVIRNADSWYISKTSPRYNVITVDVDGGGNEDFFRAFVSEVIKIKRSMGSAWSHFALQMELKDKFYELHKKVCEVIVFIFEIELNKSVTKAYLYCSLISVLWRICSHFLLII